MLTNELPIHRHALYHCPTATTKQRLTWSEVDSSVNVLSLAAVDVAVGVAVGRVQDDVEAQVGPGQVPQEVLVVGVAVARLEAVRSVLVFHLKENSVER